MRPNEYIELIFSEKSQYDPTTGQYSDSTSSKKTYLCTVTQMSIEKQLKLFGNFEKNILIVRISNYDGFKFNNCLINGQKYNIKKQELKNNNNLTLTVVESNG